MSYQVVVMYAVAAVLGLAGAAMLAALASPNRSQREVYAYRMVGIMLVAGAAVLAMSATALWNWSAEA